MFLGVVTAPGRVLVLTQGLLLLFEPHDAAVQAGLPGFSEAHCDFGCRVKIGSHLSKERTQDTSCDNEGTQAALQETNPPTAEDGRGDGSKSSPSQLQPTLGQLCLEPFGTGHHAAAARPGYHPRSPEQVRAARLVRALPDSPRAAAERPSELAQEETRWGSSRLSTVSHLGSTRTGDPRWHQRGCDPGVPAPPQCSLFLQLGTYFSHPSSMPGHSWDHAGSTR